MNWYSGAIAEAVKLSKSRNAIFVVYAEGNETSTEQFNAFLNDTTISKQLQTDDYVCIKLPYQSESYFQFAAIYTLVPLPSLFFIGLDGIPLEIITNETKTVDELHKKITAILCRVKGEVSVAPKIPDANTEIAHSSSDVVAKEDTKIIKTEQVDTKISESNVVIENEEQTKIDEEEKQNQKENENVKENEKENEKEKDKEKENEKEKQKESEKEKEIEMQQKQLKLEEEEKQSLEKKMQKAKEIIEEKRKQREAEEKEAAKERELQRRRAGQDLQNFKHRQQELELKELREERKRNKIEEQTVRKRILDQIAQDRAERSEKFIPTPTIEQQPTTSSAIFEQQNPAPSYNSIRIQFKKPDGNADLYTFAATDKFDIVREHVKTNILIGSGINNFALVTTFPRREFKSEHDEKTLLELDLAPSAVILILPIHKSGSGKTATASIVSKASGTFSYLTFILSTLLSPVYFIYGYLKSLVTGNQQPNNNVGAQKRANEDSMSPNDVAKRRNLDLFTRQQQPSDEPKRSPTEGKPYKRNTGNVHRLSDNRDSDDENNTWNGNSTQQQ